MRDEQLEQLKAGAAAVAAGAPVSVITIERRRLATPRVLTPAEADVAFQERVIEVDTGR